MRYLLATIPLHVADDVVFARRIVKYVGELVGIPVNDRANVVAAASEAARNALVHAGGGDLRISFVRTGTLSSLLFEVKDEGPGIAEGSDVLRGGEGSHGLRLARRLVDEFELVNRPGRGLTVRMTIDLPLGYAVSTAQMAAWKRSLSELDRPNTERHRTEDSNNLVSALSELRDMESELLIRVSQTEEMNRELELANLRIRTLNTRLEEQNDELLSRNRELDDFAHVVSHDLKAPLHGIRHLASWILEDVGPRLEGPDRENLDLLMQRVSRMESMIDGLLAYSRAGRDEMPSEDFHLESFLHDLTSVLTPGRPAQIDVGPLDVRTVRTDRVALAQVIRNLVANALMHTNKRKPHVRITAKRAGDAIQIIVDDDGPGVDEAHRERIFKVFTTLKPKDQHDTTGIGLAICRKLVERRGGAIEVADSPLGGARFIVEWPERGPNEETPEQPLKLPPSLRAAIGTDAMTSVRDDVPSRPDVEKRKAADEVLARARQRSDDAIDEQDDGEE